jgi:hypothetical protein
MDETSRFWSELVGRLTGPLTFRLILQPVMAAINAARDGVKDARQGRPPLLLDDVHEAVRTRAPAEGRWTAELRVIVLGVVMDLVYQYIVFKASGRSSSSSWSSSGVPALCSSSRSVQPDRAPLEKVVPHGIARPIRLRSGARALDKNKTARERCRGRRRRRARPRRAHPRRQFRARTWRRLHDVGRARGPQSHGGLRRQNMIDKDEYPQTAEIESRCATRSA